MDDFCQFLSIVLVVLAREHSLHGEPGLDQRVEDVPDRRFGDVAVRLLIVLVLIGYIQRLVVI